MMASVTPALFDAQAARDLGRELGQSIRNARNRQRLTTREIAKRCGVSVALVDRWENGLELPDPHRWKRLRGSLRSILTSDRYKKLVDAGTQMLAETQPSSDPTRRFLVEAAKLTPPDAPLDWSEEEAEDDPEPPPPSLDAKLWPLGTLDRPDSFGVALLRCRQAEAVTQHFVADLVGVIQSTVSTWERGVVTPILEHYERLLQLFPKLVEVPRPDDIRDMAKPSGPLGLKLGAPPPRGPDVEPRSTLSALTLNPTTWDAPLPQVPLDDQPENPFGGDDPVATPLQVRLGKLDRIVALVEGLEGRVDRVQLERFGEGWRLSLHQEVPGQNALMRGPITTGATIGDAVGRVESTLVEELTNRRRELDRLAKLAGV